MNTKLHPPSLLDKYMRGNANSLDLGGFGASTKSFAGHTAGSTVAPAMHGRDSCPGPEAGARALRTIEAQLKAILDATDGGILAVDSAGKVIRTNEQFANLWKIPDQLLVAADEQAIQGLIQAQLKEPEAVAGMPDAPSTLALKDGRLVERYSSPIILDGSIIGRVWSFRDMTESKLMARELHEAVEEFRDLVEQAMSGIHIVQDRKFVYVNPRFCEIHGYAHKNELIGTSPLSLIAKKDHRAIIDAIRRLLEGEESRISHNMTALRKDGSTVEVGVSSSRGRYRGRPAVISMMQDISDKKRIEEDNQRYIEQLQLAFMSTVEVATIINEMRDPYTAGHERRVAEIAVAIGTELGFDAHRREGLNVAGHLHDIGKIIVPAEILSKPGRLGPLELQLLQGHAKAGFDVLKGVAFPWPVAQIALQHHERLDGSGYPQGLESDAILIEARIMAVADVVEAMASHRPYRAALGMEKALDELDAGRGSKYDPVVTDACLDMIREGRYQIPE